MARFLSFAILSALLVATRASFCDEAKASYESKVKNYLLTYHLYDEACEDIGINASRSCMEMGYFCWYNGYHYYSIASKYTVDFYELSRCVDKIDECVTSTNITEDCYNCDNYIVYFYDALQSDESSASDCSEAYRTDCYEKTAWEYCKNATAECQAGWSSLCVSHRDALWKLYYGVCGAATEYIDECGTSIPNYCNSLTGREKYTKRECNSYMSQLELCSTIVGLNSIGDLESLITMLKKTLKKTQSSRTNEFEECFSGIDVSDMITVSVTEDVYLTSESIFDSSSFLPLIAVMSIGLVIGLFVGTRLTKSRNYQKIAH